MTLRRKAIAAGGCLLAVAALAGCGQTGTSGGAHRSQAGAATSTGGDARGSQAGAKAGTKASGPVNADPPPAGSASSAAEPRGADKEVADPEESKSFPASGAVHHKAASTPVKAGEVVIAAGAPSNAEVRQELNQMHAVERAARTTQHQELTPVAGGESVGGNGTITPPPGIPAVVARVIAGGNAIADFPYVFGGGHASFVDNAYDCSGSVSYALAAGGLLNRPLVSGELANWGEPGPGRWITIYANAGHTFMDVDGMWFDTAGRSGPYASRWLVAQPPLEGYAVRHPPGL